MMVETPFDFYGGQVHTIALASCMELIIDGRHYRQVLGQDVKSRTF